MTGRARNDVNGPRSFMMRSAEMIARHLPEADFAADLNNSTFPTRSRDFAIGQRMRLFRRLSLH